MPDVQVLAPGVLAAPLDYVIPGAQEILVKAIKADFDGGGAGGSFVPAVQIIAPGNNLAGTFIANGAVAAGDSVSVSWAPFLAGAGPNGIQFDVDNVGGTLSVTTLGQAPVTGAGMEFTTYNGGAVDVIADGRVTLLSTDNGISLLQDDINGLLDLYSNGRLNITSGIGVILSIAGGTDSDIDVTTSGTGTQRYQSSDGFVWISSHTAGGENVYVFHLSPADTFLIRDSGGDAILMVTNDGPSYHIKAGHAWVADL